MEKYIFGAMILYFLSYLYRRRKNNKKIKMLFKHNITLFYQRNDIPQGLLNEELSRKLKQIADINDKSTLRDKIIAKELIKKEINLEHVNSLFDYEGEY